MAGATLCKGLNRGLGTLLAGLLAFFLDYVANVSGKKKKSIFCQILHAVFIAVAVFIIGIYLITKMVLLMLMPWKIPFVLNFSNITPICVVLLLEHHNSNSVDVIEREKTIHKTRILMFI